MRILAGDIGGTKTLVALYEGEPWRLEEVESRRYESGDFPGLRPILEDFLPDGAGVEAAAFGVAGPVVDDVCEATNLPWTIEGRRLEAELGIPQVTLLNDFAAVALGVDELAADELLVLQDREVDPAAPAIVLGAGTGLGEAILIPERDGGLPRVLSTEGGHTDFPPRDDFEIGLLRFLQKRHSGRVSVERVLSGRGLIALYDYVVEAGLAPRSEDLEARFASSADRAAVIGAAAVEGSDPACRLAAERFVACYGSEAGNFALKTLPYGGVLIAGGIAPKLAPVIEAGAFIRAFRDKGRMSPLLHDMRVSVIMNPRVGLLGARRAAAALAAGAS